ncbi:hypothetical protein [Viridibacillus arvi]|uniref:hypothetical protein n=1 Tax=Viridibacillus arvi TaxID=263475 RepID=UPI003D2D3D33
MGSMILDRNILLLLAFVSCLFNGGFAMLYTPIMTLVINSLTEGKRNFYWDSHNRGIIDT